jgi:iron complex outermembrane receptor protein
VLSARIEHELPTLNLVSITSWQDMHAFFQLDQDMTPAKIVAAPISQYGRTITQELQALSRPESTIEWIVGAYYLDDTAEYDPLALEGAAALPFESLKIQSRQHTTSMALFGQTSVPITSRTKVTAGARFTRDERHIAGTTVGTAGETAVMLDEARQRKTGKNQPGEWLLLQRLIRPSPLTCRGTAGSKVASTISSRTPRHP